MFRYVFGLDDLARTRFAVSPLWELVRSLTALRDPSTAALHLPWLRGLSGRLEGLDLRGAVVLVPPRGYTPDFLTPPPAGPLGDIDEELARLRATPAAQIRTDIAVFQRQHPHPAAEAWLERPRRELGRLVRTLEAFWGLALAPHWARLRALLDADVAHRARALSERGTGALLGGLHPTVRFAGDVLTVEQRFPNTIELAGRGLLLMPSVFLWERPANITRAPWQPTLIYPARGVATLWEAPEGGPEGLARVVGRGRADLLAALAAPASTTDLARRLGMTPGGVSQHLGALKAAGLVSGRREGRAVLYVRTPVADALLVSGTG